MSDLQDLFDQAIVLHQREHQVAALTDAVSKGDIQVVSAFGDKVTKVAKDCSAMPEMKFDISKFMK